MNEELIENEEKTEPCEDSTEELLKRYDGRRRRRIDDIPAVQSVVCLLLAAAVVAGNIFYPELTEPVYEKLCRLISDEQEVMPNLIDVIMEKL